MQGSAVGNTVEQRETGNRMIGWGMHFQVLRFGCRFGKSAICHLPSIQSSSQVAGLIHSALHSVLNAALN